MKIKGYDIQRLYDDIANGLKKVIKPKVTKRPRQAILSDITVTTSVMTQLQKDIHKDLQRNTTTLQDVWYKVENLNTNYQLYMLYLKELAEL